MWSNYNWPSFVYCYGLTDDKFCLERAAAMAGVAGNPGQMDLVDLAQAILGALKGGVPEDAENRAALLALLAQLI
jgi:hypothetical protein